MPINPVTGPAVSTVSLKASAQAWAEGFNFGSRSAVERLDIARTKAPTTGPLEVQRAHALYRSWEDNDLGSVRLLKVPLAGQTVWALHTTTDGDDGFLELYSERGALLSSGVTGFSASGARAVTWDATPGAVREQVAPASVSPSVEAFREAIARAQQAASASGTTVSVGELREASRALVGDDLTTASVDGWEKAGLLRVLNDAKHTAGSRAWGEQLAALYTPAANTTLYRFATRNEGARTFASAELNKTGSPPRLNTMTELARRAFDALPSQVVPVTRSEALDLLREAGVSAADARATVDGLIDAGGQLYAGRSFTQGDDWVPKAKGLVLFGASASGRELKAVQVPTTTPPPAFDARDVIKRLLGVDRPVEVVASRGDAHDLAWLPPTGGRITATVTGDSISDLVLPPVTGGVEASMAQRLSTALGTPQVALAYANSGNDWYVAHRPTAGGEVTVSKVRVAVGGAIDSVAPHSFGTGAAQLELARFLALGLARVRAQEIAADPHIDDPAMPLEVALRTRWATVGDVEALDPQDSPVGTNPATDLAQYMLPRVWGDLAVVVTFEKDGGVRLEDFN